MDRWYYKTYSGRLISGIMLITAAVVWLLVMVRGCV